MTAAPSNTAPASHTVVVIGGGRWGRIVAGKFAGLGFAVHVATDFPRESSDIGRERIALLHPAPRLIYIASTSTDHEPDFRLVDTLGIPVWVEKNVSRLPDDLRHRFLSRDNCIFNQQLYNASLDRHAQVIAGLQAFVITTGIERPIKTPTELFDWICHDLSLVARILWLRRTLSPLEITGGLQHAGDPWTATFRINGVDFRIVLGRSPVRFRRLPLAGGAVLTAGHDGVLSLRSAGDDVNASGSNDQDLLGAALKFALETPREDVAALTRIILEIHRVAFPLIENLPASAFE